MVLMRYIFHKWESLEISWDHRCMNVRQALSSEKWSSEACEFDLRLGLRNCFSEDRAWRTFIYHLKENHSHIATSLRELIHGLNWPLGIRWMVCGLEKCFHDKKNLLCTEIAPKTRKWHLKHGKCLPNDPTQRKLCNCRLNFITRKKIFSNDWRGNGQNNPDDLNLNDLFRIGSCLTAAVSTKIFWLQTDPLWMTGPGESGFIVIC